MDLICFLTKHRNASHGKLCTSSRVVVKRETEDDNQHFRDFLKFRIGNFIQLGKEILVL